jgi:hypothetical protein
METCRGFYFKRLWFSSCSNECETAYQLYNFLIKFTSIQLNIWNKITAHT